MYQKNTQKQDLVKLKDLMRAPFYFYLSQNYREALMQKALKIKENLRNLAKEVGCCTDTLESFCKGKTISGKKFIRADHLEKLLGITKIPSNKIERGIIAVKRGKNTRAVKIKLPITITPELALLVAKAMGDGCICSDWRFDYKNSEPELVKEVSEAINKSIGESRYTINNRDNNCYEVKFSPVIGFILYLVGVPVASKLKQEYEIPKWIKTGDYKTKRNFIRGIFDDEACVDYKGKRIILAFGKSKFFEASLRGFLNSIKNILDEFNIGTAKINFQEEYNDKIVLRFGIYGKKNFKNFQEKIGLTHPTKRSSLNKINKSYIDKQKWKRAIFYTVINSKKPITVFEVAKFNNLKVGLVKHHLLNLAKEGKISRTKGSNPALWWVPNQRLMSKKEKVLKILSKKQLSASGISTQLDIDYKYVFSLLQKLKKENLVFNNNSRPQIWGLYESL